MSWFIVNHPGKEIPTMLILFISPWKHYIQLNELPVIKYNCLSDHEEPILFLFLNPLPDQLCS